MAYKLINYKESADRVTSGENILYTISYDIKEESSVEVINKTKQLSIHQSIEGSNLSIAIISDLLFNVNVMSNQLTSGLPVVGIEEVIETVVEEAPKKKSKKVVEPVVEEIPVVETTIVETPVVEEAPAIDSFSDTPSSTETPVENIVSSDSITTEETTTDTTESSTTTDSTNTTSTDTTDTTESNG